MEVMDASLPSDDELVRRALSGDTVATELIVRRHMGAVLAHTRSKFRDRETAEEIALDTFVKAHRKLASFRHEASLRTWLLRISHRCCLDRQRRQEPSTVVLDDAEPLLSLVSARDQRDQQREADLRSTLQQEIDALPEDEREAFILVCVRGHTREEAADILDLPASTMRDRVIRAPRQLADRLGEDRTRARQA